MITTCILTLFVITTLGAPQCAFPFVPMPNDCNITENQELLYVKPCQMAYNILFQTHQQQPYRQMITHYQQKSFGCSITHVLFETDTSLKYYQYVLNITIRDPSIRNVYTTAQQSYKLDITVKGASLVATTYVGFLRGLETFSQAFSCSQSKQSNTNKCYLSKLPIKIVDQPKYEIRGLLLDTARRFVPMNMMYQMVDSLMYNKMNVFHWHLCDDDSFPLILQKHPQYAQYRSFGQELRYTIKQTKDFIKYATSRGVRVIPQLDGPAHLNGIIGIEQNQDIRCQRNRMQSTIDQTNNKSYEVIRGILEQFNQIFIDPIIQLGGDQRTMRCSKNSSYDNQTNDELYFYFRRRVRQIAKSINSSKVLMYWETSEDIIPQVFQEDQIIQFWGGNVDVIKPQSKQKIVLSTYNGYYMNRGYGLVTGSPWSTVIGWKSAYSYLNYGKNPRAQQKNIIGGIICLWTSVIGVHQIFPFTWPRGIGVGETMWNPYIVNYGNKLAKRLITQNKRMLKRGIPTQAFTSGKCMSNYDLCERD